MYNQNYDYISHHGVKGQKWGVRRYQNKDGSLTNAGKKMYKKANKNLEKSNYWRTYQDAASNNLTKFSNSKNPVKKFLTKTNTLAYNVNKKAADKYSKKVDSILDQLHDVGVKTSMYYDPITDTVKFKESNETIKYGRRYR